jgi:hypothetical protein
MARLTKAQQDEREDSIERLREWLKPGDTVHTILRHVSSSGMQRSISAVKLENSDVIDLDYHVSRVLEYRFDDRRGGLKVGGCGMDMGFHLVYSLSRALYGDGYECTGKGCQSSFHQGEHWEDFTSEPVHKDGYALNHRWL